MRGDQNKKTGSVFYEKLYIITKALTPAYFPFTGARIKFGVDSMESLKIKVEEQYNIGQITKIELITGGTVNASYCVWASADSRVKKYILRQYQPKKNQNDIEFEHAIIDHLAKKEFSIVGHIKRTVSGNTHFVTLKEVAENKTHKVFNSLSTFLDGEDLYSWCNPECSFEELAGSAKALAEYHINISDFKYDGKIKSELRINSLLPTFTEKIEYYTNIADQTEISFYLKENCTLIAEEINDVSKVFNTLNMNNFPEVIIHCDFHPGNLLYKNGDVTGMFDFDWALLDIRAFDVGMALMYFCSEWEKNKNGVIHQDKISGFVSSYQETQIAFSGNAVGPLNRIELDTLQLMIRAANLFLLYWGVIDFYTKSLDPTQYLDYLVHNVKMIKWLKVNSISFNQSTGKG